MASQISQQSNYAARNGTNNKFLHFIWIIGNKTSLFLPSVIAAKKAPLKEFSEIQQLIKQGKKREVKLAIRENAWPVHSPVRSQLWEALCRQHQEGGNILDGYYWDMVNQVSESQDF